MEKNNEFENKLKNLLAEFYDLSDNRKIQEDVSEETYAVDALSYIQVIINEFQNYCLMQKIKEQDEIEKAYVVDSLSYMQKIIDGYQDNLIDDKNKIRQRFRQLYSKYYTLLSMQCVRDSKSLMDVMDDDESKFVLDFIVEVFDKYKNKSISSIEKDVTENNNEFVFKRDDITEYPFDAESYEFGVMRLDNGVKIEVFHCDPDDMEDVDAEMLDLLRDNGISCKVSKVSPKPNPYCNMCEYYEKDMNGCGCYSCYKLSITYKPKK